MKLDRRFTITREFFCGYPKPRYVARFCGNWIVQAATRAEARKIALCHQAHRDMVDSGEIKDIQSGVNPADAPDGFFAVAVQELKWSWYLEESLFIQCCRACDNLESCITLLYNGYSSTCVNYSDSLVDGTPRGDGCCVIFKRLPR